MVPAATCVSSSLPSVSLGVERRLGISSPSLSWGRGWAACACARATGWAVSRRDVVSHDLGQLVALRRDVGADVRAEARSHEACDDLGQPVAPAGLPWNWAREACEWGGVGPSGVS